MLQFSELRKGNLLNWSLKQMHPETTLPDELIEVQAVYDDKIAYSYPNIENRVEPFEDDKAEQAENTIPFAELQPIPITDEWLEKAGATISQGRATLQSLSFQWKDDLLTDGNEKVLRYLHQLQNHVEDSTGQPLNIRFTY